MCGEKVWMMNHYAGNMFFDRGGRHYSFAKYLKRYRKEPVIFCCNAVHNGTGFFFQDDSLWHIHMAEEIKVPFVFVKGRSYLGNGFGRILNMLDFYRNVKNVAKEFAKEYGEPDIIYTSSAHPLTLCAGIHLAKIYHVKCICEVRDLWPESFVSFGLVSKYNPILIPMYLYEKKMYEYADEIIFSMEGAYDYIRERKWDKDIPESKVHYINNGVDLEVFDYNRKHFSLEDEEIQDEKSFKVVYTGSIRLVNNIGKLLDVAKKINNPSIKFLIWGKGDDLGALEQQVKDEKITNVIFKGYVDKKYTPSIASRADLNIVSFLPASVDEKYGISPNKLFDYMAAGKPILTVFPCKYNPAVQTGAGEAVENPTVENIAAAIERFAEMDRDAYLTYCQNARKGAEQYDFKHLTQRLLEIMTK